MPRVKVYTEPRKKVTFRIPDEKFIFAQTRASELGFSTINKYFEHLIADDLLLTEIKKRETLLSKEKGTK